MPSDPYAFDELKLPFIFVPHGAPEPTDWMRDHPEYIKLPATFVPRTDGDGGADPSPGTPPPGQRRTIDGLAAPPDPAAPRPPTGNIMSNAMQGAMNEAPDRASAVGDPIAAYLEANEALATAAGSYAPEPTAASTPPADAGNAPADGTTPSSSLLERMGRAILHAIITPAEASEDLPTQAARQQNAPPSQTIPAARWNAQAGADYLHDPGHTYRGYNFVGRASHGFCAPAVRSALSAAGVDTSGHLVDAKDYANKGFLQSRGFTPLKSLNGYTPQVGDVAVWQPPPDHSAGEAGHIEYYDGQRWLSDYVQRSPTRGPFATDQYGIGFSPGIEWTDAVVFRHQ